MKKRLLVLLIVIVGLSFSSISVIAENSQDVNTDAGQQNDAYADPNSVTISYTYESDDLLAMQFNANDIDAGLVFAVVMNMMYDNTVLEYVSYEEGNFLNQNGERTVTLCNSKAIRDSNGNETGQSRIAIGISLFKGSPGITGSGSMITLRFRVQPNIVADMYFTKKKLVQLDDDAQYGTSVIPGISWPVSIEIPIN